MATKNIPSLQPFVISTTDGLFLIYGPSDFNIQMLSDSQFDQIITESKRHKIENRKILIEHSDEIGDLIMFKQVNKLFPIPQSLTFSINNGIVVFQERGGEI